MRYIGAAILLAIVASPFVIFITGLVLAVGSDSLGWRIAGWLCMAASVSLGVYLAYQWARGMSSGGGSW